jgi:hypothetical protein
MSAPNNFVKWLSNHRHKVPGHKQTYNYHPRSDRHSVAICTEIVKDLLDLCPLIQEHAARGLIAYGINISHTWPNDKTKTLDLALGKPSQVGVATSELQGIARAKSFQRVFISCEAKTVMTEHKKSQPRVFDELSSSHEIVHQGDQSAIAAGITVVNIANSFVSPLRQRPTARIKITQHSQPRVADSMIKHLRGLPIRDAVGEVGFDAYATIVIDCDNIHGARLWAGDPAPQPGDPDYYEEFVRRICRFYSNRAAAFELPE